MTVPFQATSTSSTASLPDEGRPGLARRTLTGHLAEAPVGRTASPTWQPAAVDHLMAQLALGTIRDHEERRWDITLALEESDDDMWQLLLEDALRNKASVQ